MAGKHQTVEIQLPSSCNSSTEAACVSEATSTPSRALQGVERESQSQRGLAHQPVLEELLRRRSLEVSGIKIFIYISTNGLDISRSKVED